ncbi:hypothetical protein CO115_03270, partial [Candidatus Falkowbacteria bacterium CG_4_9_14_3_um_filter_36_9]
NFEVEVMASSEKDAFNKAQELFEGYDENYITEPFWEDTELDIGNGNINKLSNGIYIEEID